MKTPVGVIPLYDESRESYWMLPGYIPSPKKNNAADGNVDERKCIVNWEMLHQSFEEA